MTDYRNAHNSNKILSNSMQFNGRVNALALAQDEDARFKMFEKVAVKNKATDYRGAIKYELEESALSDKFFSKEKYLFKNVIPVNIKRSEITKLNKLSLAADTRIFWGNE